MPHLIVFFLKILVAVTLVTAGVFIVLRYYLGTKRSMTVKEPGNEEQRILLPLRLQAYERLILFLERIAPANLIIRVSRQDMSASQLQAALVRTIREEFEYNLSQQIYVSVRSWELIKSAKEDVIRMINTAGTGIPESSSGQQLSSAVFDLLMSHSGSSVDLAIAELKSEVRKLF